MVSMAAELLMDTDVDVLCNAGYGERSDDRRELPQRPPGRRWDTRAGTISLDVPKLRHGSYLPSLLEPRRRAEQALVSVVCQAYIEGVSTRRVDDLVRSMGIDGISKSQVSALGEEPRQPSRGVQKPTARPGPLRVCVARCPLTTRSWRGAAG